jgi:hypothetical protein
MVAWALSSLWSDDASAAGEVVSCGSDGVDADGFAVGGSVDHLAAPDVAADVVILVLGLP